MSHEQHVRRGVGEPLARNAQESATVGTSALLRGVWLAIIVLASLMVAAAVAALLLVSGSDLEALLGMSGAAFVASVTIGITARRFLEA